MSKEEITQYIQTKGEMRKNEMYESMLFQTKDYLRSKMANESIGSMTDSLAQQKSEWEEQ